MSRRVAMLLSGVLATTLSLGLVAGTPAAGGTSTFTPGAPGVGDPYFPLDGNGGYDVKHYGLDLKYTPANDRLAGTATIRARATQNLSRFNLDLHGLTVRSITVDGKRARWSRSGDELTVVPRHGLHKSKNFTTVIRYDGVPETIDDASGISGFVHTDDGAVVAGQPHGAATWYPVNDHPTDKAAYTFRITARAGLEAVANGVLVDRKTRHGWTTWTWDAKEPMASYLATIDIGQFDLKSYRRDGIRYWDAVDPDLSAPVTPRTGQQYALSGKVADGETGYKRLTRTISVPAGGARVSFWIDRETEAGWDFVFVEARTAGQNDWTTLPDLNGNTNQDTGPACPGVHGLHPFLTHYQTAQPDGSCTPNGSSGAWNAASGDGGPYEQWTVDLGRYAGRNAEVSISYVSDDLFQFPGLFVDDIVVSTGAGTTSFEADGNTFDGWTVPGAPAGSPANPNDWTVGTAADAPPTTGSIAWGSLGRQPEIIGFLADNFGRYPFSAAGGIVDDTDDLTFALETQTRPVYSKTFFTSPESGDSVVVHELAHQWFGDSLALKRWQHIWLNEGFATYAEWLWSEREGLGTAQEIFDFYYNDAFPAGDPFWELTIGDPGPDGLFDFAVYARGAMTLHQLRLTVGDGTFFRILRTWAAQNRGGNVTTAQFIAHAERVSGQQLDALFDAWLFTTTRPALPSVAAAADVPAAALAQLDRHEQKVMRR
jgi:peptidase M1-like protein